MKRLVTTAGALMLASACASAAPGVGESGTVRSTTTVSGVGGTVTIDSYADRGGTVHTLQAPVDRVWAALPAAYQALGLPAGTSVPATHTYGNARLEANRQLAGKPLSTWIDCGVGPFGRPLADSYAVNASVLTTLAPAAGGQTQLRTQVVATASARGVSDAPVNCGTTGGLEARIAEQVIGALGS